MSTARRTRPRRGIHTRPTEGETVEWMTPPEILAALGPFDLDPCAHPSQPWRTAARMIAPPDDGLTADWGGAETRVWLNPPYSSQANARWLARLARHGNGIALVAARTEVEEWFWPFVWEAATALLFRRGRLTFYHPDGTKGDGNSGHASVFVAYGQANAEALRRSGIAGAYVELGRVELLAGPEGDQQKLPLGEDTQ